MKTKVLKRSLKKAVKQQQLKRIQAQMHRTVELIRDNPGCTGAELIAAGWNYSRHGSLQAAMAAGYVYWNADKVGWFTGRLPVAQAY
jgi:hypothetical protein